MMTKQHYDRVPLRTPGALMIRVFVGGVAAMLAILTVKIADMVIEVDDRDGRASTGSKIGGNRHGNGSEDRR